MVSQKVGPSFASSPFFRYKRIRYERNALLMTLVAANAFRKVFLQDEEDLPRI